MDDKQELTDKQKQRIIDYQTTFNSEQGKCVLKDLRRESGYEDKIVPQGVPDVTAYALGARDMFLYIKDKMDAKPDKRVQVESEIEDATD